MNKLTYTPVVLNLRSVANLLTVRRICRCFVSVTFHIFEIAIMSLYYMLNIIK